MNKALLKIFAMVVGTAVWSPGWADVQFQPRIIGGIMDYEIEFDGTDADDGTVPTPDIGSPEDQITIQDEMPIVGLGATVVSNEWYADAYFQTTVRGQDDVALESGFPRGNVDIKRDDFAFSVGRSFGRLSVFGGYRFGDTRFEQDFSDPIDGNLTTVKTTFEEEGPFVGVSYGHAVGRGVLGFSAAVARLDLDYKQRFTSVPATPSRQQPPFSGDSVGFNIGLAWRMTITGSLYYSLAVDAYRYEFDIDGDNFSDTSFTERAYAARAQVGATF